MSTPLVCGPFTRSGMPGTAAYMRAPLRVQGDWVGTPQGQEKLEQAEGFILKAAAQGDLPPDTRVEYQDGNTACVVLPFRDWASAERDAEDVKKNLLTVTSAALNEDPSATLPKKR